MFTLKAKAWGDSKNFPVVVLHGRQDNAASFDYLIPLLPKNYYYVCLDLPGHGKSSPTLGQLNPHILDYCAVLKMLLDHFKWEECYGLGHSMGALIIIRTAQLFPSYFKKIAVIDGAYTLPVEIDMYQKQMVQKFNGIIKFQQNVAQKREQPTYTYEEALRKVSESRNYEPLPKEKAGAILNRMIESVGDGRYRFTVDPKWKYALSPVHDSRYSVELVKTYPITCPMLVIVDSAHDVLLKQFMPVLKQYEKQKNVIVKYIAANHDMHITIPHVIAPLISDLFNKAPASKL